LADATSDVKVVLIEQLRCIAYKPQMDHRRLKFFVAVAEELHFTRAAARVRIAQPHLSQEIRKLERDIGVQLFSRTKRSVALTPAGHVFLQRVRALFDATTEAVNAAQRANRGEIGRLAVGFVSAAAYAVIPDAVARFRKAYPDVELLLSELNSDEGVEAVRGGRLDLCLLHPPRHLDNALRIEAAWDEPLLVALPQEHMLASVRHVDLKKLESEPWVLWPREIASRLYDEVIAVCASAGFEPRVAQRTTRLATVVSLVASGVGVALVPRTAGQMGINGVTFRPLRNRRIEVPMSFVWREQEAPASLPPFMAAVRTARSGLAKSRSPLT
jgi:DNA-binding transcriptional LysR family regulator